MNIEIPDLYSKLYSYYGETGWWPAETPDEIVVGTILTQNTSWRNVEISIQKLKENNIASLHDIASSEVKELADIIKSSGFYMQKASRLIDISNAIITTYGNLEELKHCSRDESREFLSKLKGIGQETMDCILLYVLEKPVFVVDKYTLRMFSRVGIENKESLEAKKAVVEKNLDYDVSKLKNLHGMIVELGKEFCKAKPLCIGCPLKEQCDYGSRLH